MIGFTVRGNKSVVGNDFRITPHIPRHDVWYYVSPCANRYLLNDIRSNTAAVMSTSAFVIVALFMSKRVK